MSVWRGLTVEQIYPLTFCEPIFSKEFSVFLILIEIFNSSVAPFEVLPQTSTLTDVTRKRWLSTSPLNTKLDNISVRKKALVWDLDPCSFSRAVRNCVPKCGALVSHSTLVSRPPSGERVSNVQHSWWLWASNSCREKAFFVLTWSLGPVLTFCWNVHLFCGAFQFSLCPVKVTHVGV